MPNFRRYYIPNRLVFITNVTHNRQPILHGEENLRIFWNSVRQAQARYEFHLFAYAIMPDHFHWIVVLPENDPDFSKIMRTVKWYFAADKKKHDHIANARIWQARFWDHIIRDEDDLSRHVDYIHWNPVKHGFVDSPEKWKESSFSFWTEKGYYGKEWGFNGEPANLTSLDFE